MDVHPARSVIVDQVVQEQPLGCVFLSTLTSGTTLPCRSLRPIRLSCRGSRFSDEEDPSITVGMRPSRGFLGGGGVQSESGVA